jgi:hypothetical protein
MPGPVEHFDYSMVKNQGEGILSFPEFVARDVPTPDFL